MRQQVLVTLKNGAIIYGYSNCKNYNGFYYVNREGYRKVQKYHRSEVISLVPRVKYY